MRLWSSVTGQSSTPSEISRMGTRWIGTGSTKRVSGIGFSPKVSTGSRSSGTGEQVTGDYPPEYGVRKC